MKLKYTLHFLWMVCLFACQPTNTEQASSQTYVQTMVEFPFLGYDLQQPTAQYKLTSSLEEISGLTYLNAQYLAAVQDEEGVIFFFDLEEKKITKRLPFGKKGDYEGLTFLNDTFYVLRSDGTIFEIEDYQNPEREAKKYTTFLKKGYDMEGLCYDASKNALLLACKDWEDKKHKKPIFAFDLKSKTLAQEPAYLIDTKVIAEKLELDKTHFKPSGIAFHPQTKNLYILAHSGRKLLVLDKEGFIKNIQTLPKKLFKQAEGICFAPDGTLFIANEGDGGKGTILQFDYQK